MNTRMPALITAGTLALSLTACGGGAPEEEPANEAAATPEEGGGSVLDLVDDLASSTEEVTNYTLDMEMRLTGSEDPEMTMTYEVMDDPEAMRVSMYTAGAAEVVRGLAEMAGEDLGDLSEEELSTSISILLPDGEILNSNHTGLQAADTAWTRGGSMEGEGAEEQAFGTDSMSSLTAAFTGIEFQEVGPEEVNGAEATNIEGSLTPEEFDALPQEQKDAVDEVLPDVAGTLNVSLWITDDGFPMRIDMADDEAEVSTVFSSIGETSFEIPSEDEITDI